MRLARSNAFPNTFSSLKLSSSLDSLSNKARAFTSLFKGNTESKSPCRLTLENAEVVRVPQGCRELQVLSGTAWMTVDRQDIILLSGDKASLPSNKDFAIVSALGNAPLILEVF
jgi:hypothetical protein